jgi:Fe2+ or Zn2+ uptake regulation protein
MDRHIIMLNTLSLSYTEQMQQLRHELRLAGLKVTHTRLKILYFFRQYPTALFSAKDLYLTFSDIKISTLYRVLSDLDSAGFLIKISLSDEKMLYRLKHAQDLPTLIILTDHTPVVIRNVELINMINQCLIQQGCLPMTQDVILHSQRMTVPSR